MVYGHTRRIVVALGAILAVTGAVATPSASATKLFAITTHSDAKDTPGSPLDLVDATFSQQGTDLVLRLSTTGSWDPAQLSPTTGRTLCVKLYYGMLLTPRARVCVTGTNDAPSLRYTRLDPFGAPFRVQDMAVAADRPDDHSIEASMSANAAALPLGRFAWQAESQWSADDGTCNACRDTVPNNGPAAGRVRLLAEPRCFGAAARRSSHPCDNPALRGIVEPRPEDAILEPNQFCLPVIDRTGLTTCRFQAPPFGKAQTIALLGDSHAAHWRAALNIVATAKHWRGISMTRSGCPFSAATPILPGNLASQCLRYRRRVYQWFREHPEVHVVFISGHIGNVVDDGSGPFQTQVHGFIRALRELPRTVKHVFVIRDTPQEQRRTQPCVISAIAHRHSPSKRCAVPRSFALKIDPASVAGHKLHGGRVHVIDMTKYFCGRHSCYPVIGHALVHKDRGHLTEVYSTTLGPFLLDRVNSALR